MRFVKFYIIKNCSGVVSQIRVGTMSVSSSEARISVRPFISRGLEEGDDNDYDHSICNGEGAAEGFDTTSSYYGSAYCGGCDEAFGSGSDDTHTSSSCDPSFAKCFCPFDYTVLNTRLSCPCSYCCPQIRFPVDMSVSLNIGNKCRCDNMSDCSYSMRTNCNSNVRRICAYCGQNYEECTSGCNSSSNGNSTRCASAELLAENENDDGQSEFGT